MRALFLLVLLLAGCAPREDVVTLRFWAMGREGEIVRELMPQFEAEHPGIRVRVQQIPWTAAHEKLLTAYVGNALPDVSQMGNTWIPEFHALRALLPLDSLLARELPREAYFDGIYATNALYGRLYGAPWYVDTRLLFYRRDLFEAAGITQFPQTIAEWEVAMTQLRAFLPADAFPIVLPLNEWQPAVLFGMNAGSGLLRDDGRFSAFTEPAFREGFERLVSYYERGFAPVVSGSQIGNIYQAIARGTYVQYITGPWNLGEFAERLPAELQGAWATAPIPGTEGPGVSMAGGASLVVFNSSRHREAALKLVAYLSRPDVQLAFYQRTGSLPARREAWQDSSLTQDPRIRAFADQLERALPTPAVPEWERIAMRVMEAAEQAARGAVSVDVALQRLDTDVNRMLDKRRHLLSLSENE